jgi:small nuclear ribonucleoprotein (snRNP)-like protein
VPALGAWLAVMLLGATAAAVTDLRTPLGALVPFIVLGALAWTGYWLIAVPNMPRFRRATDARLRNEYENDFDYRMLEYQDRVSVDLQGKVSDMTILRDKAREMLKSKFGEEDLFAKDNLAKLDRLAISYLQMLVAQTEYEQYISLVDPQSIEADLEAARLTTEQSGEAGLRDVGQKQVTLLEGRLARVHKASEQMRMITGQLKNVETTMKLLLDTAMTVADPKRVGKDIDMVLQNIRDSEVLSAELSAYDDLERELELSRAGGLKA